MLRLLQITGVALGLVIFTSLVAMAGADTSPGWLQSPSLSLQKQAQVSDFPASINGNIDCVQDSQFTCAVPTAYGAASTNGVARMAGDDDYRPVYSYIDNHQNFIPVPNSNTVISYTTEPATGIYLYFTRDFSSSVTASKPLTGPQYQINRPPDGVLTNSSGQRLPADYSSISFSQNGQWMVVSAPNNSVLRVNMQTFEALPFDSGFNYDSGQAPGVQTAISNDGRYAVVASKVFNTSIVYDLNTCVPAADPHSLYQNCQYRGLEDTMRQGVPDYIGISNIRFIDDDTLSLYAGYSESGTKKIAKFIVSDLPGAINQLGYLAMGDSYISGEGAFDYQAGTDTDDNLCHLSLRGYPYLLGHDLDFNTYHSVACSGAVTDDIVNTSSKYTGQDENKVPRERLSNDNINSIKNNFQPGYIDQLDFVSTYQPQVITLSVGGNDMGFSDILKSCIDPGLGNNTCYSTYEDRLELVNLINRQVFPKLVQTYQQIKAQGPPNLRLYVIGYPQIAKPGGDCALNVHLNDQEVIFSQQLVAYLDQVIQQAAAKAGVYYVDTQDALNGHRLCEAGPGTVAMNGLTAGNNIPGPIRGPLGNESYHPNALGHQLLAADIRAATNDLTAPMPASNLNAGLPSQTNLDILKVPSSGRALSITELDSGMSKDVLLKQTLNGVLINGVDHSLPGGVVLQAVLHSDPVQLGSYRVDANGNLSAQIVIPDGVPAGYHTLHFYGTDLNGQAVDIYKVVYVADSPDDIDGDRTPDSTEPCVGVLASGQDYDQDGIDDSCDGTIGLPPSQLSVSATTTDDTVATTTALDNSAITITPSATTTALTSQQTSQGATAPKVLAAKTTKPKSTTPIKSAATQLFINQTPPPNAKVLAIAGGACAWILICYAAYKFRD